MIDIDIPISVDMLDVEIPLTIDSEYHVYPVYDGPIELVPDREYHILRVGGKMCPQDIIIHPISNIQ